MGSWNEALHPRVPKGSSEGGEFTEANAVRHSPEPKIIPLRRRSSIGPRLLKEASKIELTVSPKERDAAYLIQRAIENVVHQPFNAPGENAVHGLVAVVRRRIPVAAVSYESSSDSSTRVSPRSIYVNNLGSLRFPYGHILLSRVERAAQRARVPVRLAAVKKALTFYGKRGYKQIGPDEGLVPMSKVFK